MSHMRSVLLGAALVCAATIASTSTAAAVVSPTGSYTTTSPDSQLRSSSNGQTVTCDQAEKTLSVAANGTVSVPLGNATFSGCTAGALGTVVVAQSSAWTGAFTLSSGRVDLTITIPASGLRFTLSGCTFWIEGTIVRSAPITALPTVVASMTVTGSALRISRNNGGLLCFAFPAALGLAASGTLTLDRSLTYSG